MIINRSPSLFLYILCALRVVVATLQHGLTYARLDDLYEFYNTNHRKRGGVILKKSVLSEINDYKDAKALS